MKERKFIDLKALKMSNDGPGEISGYRSVFGEIDEGGDIVVKGFFADGISEYLQSGFTAHSHDWSFSEAVGFPVDAKEDDHGFLVTSQFHGTPDAQNIRQKAKERLDAGKSVGFSFGYAVSEKKFIEAKDFKEQLPQYIKPDRLAANLQKAQSFSRIRILLKGETIEDSLVTSPMQKLATATGIKTDKDRKGMLAEEMAETTPSWWQVESAYYRVVKKIAEGAKNSDVTGEFDWRAKVNQLSTEFGIEAASIAIAQIEAYLESSDDEFYLKGSVSDSFESFENAVAAIEKTTANMQRNHENRVKDGRVLSASNRAKVQAAYDALGALLEASEPKKPKEKRVDWAALRTQSERRRHDLISLLQ